MLKTLKQLIKLLHRWTGLAMSFLFVVWFISGFIMIYHTFPKPRPQLYFHDLNSFSGHDSIQSPHELFSTHKVSSIILEKVNDKAVYRTPGRGVSVFDAASVNAIPPLSLTECAEIVRSNFSHPIEKVEELNDFDQWIPWAHYKTHFPIQKFWLDDDKGTQVYVSSSSGTIVQETTLKSRVMAWLGAIPHWLYFKQLRLKAALWSDVVIGLSAIGCLACLSGFVLGFIRLKRFKRGAKWNSITPFKKFWYRWHHISGFIFGFFVFTFILSGLMSLADLPNWIVKKEKEINYYQLWNGSCLSSQQELIGFNKLIQQKDASSIKRIVCRKVMERTFYEVYQDTPDQSECYIVDANKVKPLPPLTQLVIEKRMKELLPQKQYSIHFLRDYSHYYSVKKRVLPPPVYEIELDDTYGTTLFVHPQTGELLKVLNRSSKWQWWFYQGLHTFNFGWFRQFEWLRLALLIFLSLGGMFVSISAFVLGIQFIKRKI